MLRHSFAALAIFFLSACSSDPGVKVPGDCPNAPTNPECQDYCDTDSTASWCAGADSGNSTSTNNDAGNTDAATGPPDADAIPCDGTCSNGEVCDEASDTCVECLSAGDCLDGVCLVDAADSSNNRCVACLADADCVAGVCDTDSNACVPCLADSDCSEADAAKCVLGATTADNACGGCDDSSQCAGIAGTEVCDVGDGICVECTSDSDCVVGADTFACSVLDNTCSDIVAGTANGCDECVSDSSCTAVNVCVPMEYMGAPRGNYCMPVFQQGMSCPPTYGTSEIDRRTIDGSLETVCLISEAVVTCEAIQQFGLRCPNGNECTADGARCELQGLEMRCTYSCAGPSTRDCPSGATCGGDQPLFCGV